MMPAILFIIRNWKVIAYFLGACVVICSIFYVIFVFNQNAERGKALEEKTAQMANLKAGFEVYMKFNREVEQARMEVAKEYEKRINEIENSTPPADGTSFVFMPHTSMRVASPFATGSTTNHQAGNR